MTVHVCLQVYHLASVRLRDLCWKLDISADLRAKIWTCFEHTLTHCTELMKGRHLDQLLLCSVYIVSKARRRVANPGKGGGGGESGRGGVIVLLLCV